MLFGDTLGAVNCLADHPFECMLATSGLESNAKIWTPTNSIRSNPDALRGGEDGNQVYLSFLLTIF